MNTRNTTNETVLAKSNRKCDEMNNYQENNLISRFSISINLINIGHESGAIAYVQMF